MNQPAQDGHFVEGLVIVSTFVLTPELPSEYFSVIVVVMVSIMVP